MTRDASLVDTHAHLADPRLLSRMSEVLTAAADAGVVQVIAIGTTAEDSRVVAGLASEHPGVFATVGIHPNEAADAQAQDWGTIEALADRPGVVVALGETGLDRHRDRTPFDVQRDYFGRHLALAA